ncbi:hypothetical protein J23TS9_05390 [Paenibacillus sp. J23TS9]|uniref:HNH endonuclease n=1 Tax=Paenibacillus sp. J23TS9 TaxID=2807193 RepID=UPI001B15736D|nr:HNH endonuclease signature motif containing protein [Paenibacillus sp. J23TS9]GIP25409.1 hypothetical protein J23TS9_05390 [Paenibacillus sp. J23TS9]
MKKLVPPRLDAMDIYSTLKNNVNRVNTLDKYDRLCTLEGTVFQRYDDYLATTNNLELLSISTITDENDKVALESCYSRNPNGYFEGRVVTQIIEIQTPQHKNNCPYCGLDSPRTIDHYLPISDFPEYSVFPPNLIPCCSYCNSKKNDRWLGVDGQRLFINMYYDNIDNLQKYLFCNTRFDNERTDEYYFAPLITFAIQNTGVIPIETYRVIESHYTKLDLTKQFSKKIEEQISVIMDKVYHGARIEVIQESLNDDYDNHIRMYGRNFWRTSFLEEIKGNALFFDRVKEPEFRDYFHLKHIVK